MNINRLAHDIAERTGYGIDSPEVRALVATSAPALACGWRMSLPTVKPGADRELIAADYQEVPA